MLHLVCALRERYAIMAMAHVILDGAAYHRSQLVKDSAFELNTQLHYLYLIERFWKVMNEQTRNNRYYSFKQSF